MEIDEEHFADLYRTMLPTVYRFATNRLGRSDGEEVTSEVFHAAVVAFRDGRAEQVTPAWLMTVAKNKVIDRWRTAARRNAIALLIPRRDDTDTFPPNWSSSLRRDAVLEALDGINPRHRALLVAHYLDGFTAADIGEFSGLSVAAVESALARARRAFRRAYLEPQDES